MAPADRRPPARRGLLVRRVTTRALCAAALGAASLAAFARLVLAEDARPAANPPAAPAAPAADGTVVEAEALLAAGKTDEALRAFQALADAPAGAEDARVLSGLGRARLLLGDAQGALEPLSKAAKQRATNYDRLLYGRALLSTATAASQSGSRSAAIVVPSYLHDAVAQAEAVKEPKGDEAAQAARMLGEAKLGLDDAAGAREALSSSALVDDPAGLDLLARACFALKDFPAAATAWEKAKNPRAAAIAYTHAKDLKAVAIYARLLEASPKDIALLDEAVRAAVAVGKVEELDAALAGLSEKGAAIPRARGRLAEWAGKKDEAVARYREARALAPDDLDVTTDLGRALVIAKPEDAATVDEATALFLGVLKGTPSADALGWARSDLAYIATRDTDAAVKDWPDRRRLDRDVTIFRALADADPTDGTAWQNLGNALRNAGDPAGAVEAMKKGVACNPYDAGIQNNLGIAHVAAGERDAALAAFEAASKLDPTDTAPRQNGGRLRLLRGDLDPARDEFAAALSSTRSIGGGPSLFRFLLDRVWRTRTGATPR